jgi:hypothetical protein
MRQRCELCESIGCHDSVTGSKLIGVWVGTRDALLCPDHALFALDSDVVSLAELVEVYEFVNDLEPALSGKRRRRSSAAGDASAVVLAAAGE